MDESGLFKRSLLAQLQQPNALLVTCQPEGAKIDAFAKRARIDLDFGFYPGFQGFFDQRTSCHIRYFE